MFQNNPILKTTFIIIVIVGFVACTPEDDNGGMQDAGADSSQVEDTEERDPLADAEPDAREDVGQDTGSADVEDDVEEDTGTDCEPEVVAAEHVAVNDTFNDGAVSVETQDGVHTVTLDASSGGVAEASSQSFVYIDFDAPEKLELSDAEAFEDDAWDIAFRRTEIRINGGDSGPGNWLLSDMDSSWDDATQPPGQDAEWVTDDFVDDACNVETTQRGAIVTAFGQWYDYNPQTHEVSAPDNATWALYNTGTHSAVKFGIASYASGQYEVRIGGF